MTLHPKQVDALLLPLAKSRVAERQGFSYLQAYDVKAHLIRVFGFGNFDADVIGEPKILAQEKVANNWHVSALVTVCLRIHATDASYTEAAVGSARLPNLGEALDMAVKTAESDALKRAATYLGDQFGLSLYANGSTDPVVIRTIDTAEPTDLQEPVVPESRGTGLDTSAPIEVSDDVIALAQECYTVGNITDVALRVPALVELKGRLGDHLNDLVYAEGKQVTLERLHQVAVAGRLVGRTIDGVPA